MQGLFAGLMVLTAEISGYPLPIGLPKIEAVPHQHLIDVLCDGQKCNAVAYYDDKKNTIFYDDAVPLASIQGQSFIIHEMVHYLQYRNDVVPAGEPSCQARMELEREAYIVQGQFLQDNDQVTYPVEMAIYMLGRVCDE